MKLEWLHVAMEKAKPTEQHHHPVEHPPQPAVVWYLPEEDQDEDFPLAELTSFNVRPGRVSLEASQQINQKVKEITEELIVSKGLGNAYVVRVGLIRPHHNESWYHDLATLNASGNIAGVYMQGFPEGYMPSRMEVLQAAGLNVWPSEEALKQGIREFLV